MSPRILGAARPGQLLSGEAEIARHGMQSDRHKRYSIIRLVCGWRRKHVGSSAENWPTFNDRLSFKSRRMGSYTLAISILENSSQLAFV